MRELFEMFQNSQNKRMDKLDKRFSDLNVKMSAVQNTNQEIEKAVDVVSEKLSAVQTVITKLESDRREIRSQLAVLDDKCDAIERNARKTCVEIRNVPKVPKETRQDLYNLVKTLTGHLDMKIDSSEIRDVFRLPIGVSKDTSTLIVELPNTLLKGNFLDAVKKFSKRNSGQQLNSSHLGLGGTKSTVYCSEYLTAKSKKLHYLARDFAKTEKYAFCWTAHGKVYLRKAEGDRYVLVKGEEQLQELRREN